MKQLIPLTLMVAVAMCYEPFQVIFKWKTFDFQWPSNEERQYAIKHGDYIAKNNIFTTVKFWKDKMYIALPRLKDGVPVTLGATSAMPVNGVTAPKLKAFPSWAMQKLGDCYAFQQVHSMEIDSKGRMWVLDIGRTGLLANLTARCPPRLVILDLEDDGKILRIYKFPDHVARHGVTYLNDIVLDYEDGMMAYITDSSEEDYGIIVYSLKHNTSWKMRHKSMKAEPEAVKFTAAHEYMTMPVSVDGIALSPASSYDRQVYYMPLSSFHLYSIPVSTLKSNTTNIDHYVKKLGRKNSQTDGIITSAKNVFYFGLLANDAISMWNIKNSPSFTAGQRVLLRDHMLIQWPNSFAFDESGNLWCVINKLPKFINNHVNVNSFNYYLIRTHVGVRSYLYYENDTAPELPDIPSQ